MKFLNRYKENTIRVIFIVIALYCIILSATSFVNVMIIDRLTVDDCLWTSSADGFTPARGIIIDDITPGGAADKSGLRNKDIFIAINGREFANTSEAQKILNEYDEGDVVEYTVIREGRILNFKVDVYRFFNVQYLIFSLLGFGFIMIGLAVGYSRPKELTSQIFFFLSCSALLGFNLFGNVNTFSFPFIVVNFIIGLVFFFPLFVHFFLTYPITFESPKRRYMIGGLYGLMILLYVIQYTLGGYLDLQFSILLFIVMIAYLVLGFAIFIVSFTKLKGKNQKRALKIIMYGFIIGIIGFIYSLIIPMILNVPTILIEPWILLPAVLVLAIPVSFGYSIFRYKIMDTELIVKRSLVFGFITAFVIALYLLFVFVLDSFLSGYLGENRQIITIGMIIVITFTFDFVNKKVKDFVDTQFYRERYNYRQSLLLFSEELPYINNFREILQKIGRAVNETMGVKTLNIWIKDLDYYKLLNKDEEDNLDIREKRESFDRAFTELFKNDFEPKFLYSINLSDLKVTEENKDIFRQGNIVLSVPITLKNKLIGAFNFGEKPSGKTYSDEDIDLLKTLASQSAIAFENSRLQIEEVSKRKIEEELHIAQRIQFGLLPQKDTTIEGLNISTTYQPAKIIGGDFYDLIKIDKDRLLIVVADVSGKGIPAALYMSKVQAMIQFAARVFTSPRDILREVNKHIVNKIDKKTFITIIMALIDLKEGNIKVCRAGHNPLIYFNNGKTKTLENKGMGIGIGEQEMFVENLEETELTIKENDVFVFYSDGLTEAMNGENELLGIDSVVRVIEDNKFQSVDVISEKIVSSVSDFRKGAEQNDDITMVVVKIQ